jgi:ELWxxDGT repeat protein
MVSDIYTSTPGSAPTELYVWNNDLYFQATTAANGNELWKMNGGSPVLVKDVYTGSPASYPSNFFGWNGKLYFMADSDGANGSELWSTTKAVGNATLVKNFSAPTVTVMNKSFFELNGFLYFIVSQTNTELWKTDGTTAGTTMVSTLYNNSVAMNFSKIQYGNYVYFSINWTSGNYLFRTDGTTAGTAEILSGTFTGGSSAPVTQLTLLNNTIYFIGQSATTGYELWKLVP